VTDVLTDHAFIAAFAKPDRRTYRNRARRDVFSETTLRLIVEAPSWARFRNDAEAVASHPDFNHPRLGVTLETLEGNLFHLLIACLREVAEGESFPAKDRLACWAAIDCLRQPPPV
jgi:hypothetical protein